MKVSPTCPLGKYTKDMKIVCTKVDNLCAHQFFRQCKGWWANTEQADRCPLREKEETQ